MAKNNVGSCQAKLCKGTIRRGGIGTRHKWAAIQVKLKESGLFAGPFDGTFSAQLRSAVALFQRMNGLDADGEVGPLTWQKIMSAPSKPAQALSEPQLR